MTATKSPAFQFYPDDFLGSGKVGTMTTEEVGAYTLLLCLEWNETGFLYDEEELSRWCRMTRPRFRSAWRRVSRCFVERDGRMFNPRLDVERAKQAEWREKSRRGGVKSGQLRSKGGSTVVQPPYEPNGQPNANQSPTLQSPSPTPVTTKRTALSATADEQHVLDHYATRHPRRKLTPSSVKIVRKALGFGYTAQDLCEAIDGNADDRWHREKHKHELSYVLRNTDLIDGFRANAIPVGPIVDEFGCLTPYGERITRPE